MKTNLIIMTLMCAYMYKLALGYDFIYYIHPRYIIFSILATLVCTIIVLKTWKNLDEIHSHTEKRSQSLSFLIVCTLIIAIVIPAKGLTYTTAIKRFNSGGQTVTIKKEIKVPQSKTSSTTNSKTEIASTSKVFVASGIEKTSAEKESADSTLASKNDSESNVLPFIIMPTSNDPGDIFSDFVFSLENTDNVSSFKNTEIELIGFVLIEQEGNVSQYHVSRFFIACCTADANPIGIPFEYSGTQYKNDDWVKVKGKLKIIKQGDFEKVMIVPSSIEKVIEPKFPYAYY